jgi:transcriptional antiterminator NusG
VTEQTGQNPEVLQDPPAMQAGVDPQSDIAPVAAEQAGHPRSGSGSGEQEAVGEPISPEPVAEAAPPEPVAEEAATEPVKVAKAAARPRAESAKARKAAASAAAVVPASAPEVPKSENMNWYILKVQSNREESIREGLLRRVSIQGLEHYFGEVIVPTEKVTEFKGGKKRVIKRKLYPGYIVVHMEINEDTWFLVRETPGIGDFTGASGVPSVMLPHEVERIIAKQEEKSEKAPDLKIPFLKGDRVKIIEGNFENFEGEVDAIDKTNGRVTVMITIFNRTTPVEFEYWQVESV